MTKKDTSSGVFQPVVLVAAAVLIDNQSRLLLAERPKGKPMTGLWEFPGGKIHANETPEQALVRELYEELGLTLDPKNLLPLTFASHAYSEFHLLMPVFACRVWQGTPHPKEGQSFAWVKKEEARKYAMPPADEKILPLILKLV